MSVPVIDLFAGPGGLGEGFSKATTADFEIKVSIEKDEQAFETLRLRAAHRALSRARPEPDTWLTWDRIVADSPWNIVFELLTESGDSFIEAACAKARSEAWNLEMGPSNRELVEKGILERLGMGGAIPSNSVLIGGPPCQAYSVVGRSRNQAIEGYRAEEDHRHFLYLEYLQVIRTFRPAVFVMENVKGILSSTVSQRQIFETIFKDLERPDAALGSDEGLEYRLFALSPREQQSWQARSDDFIVRAEDFGVPQARHRVIIFGVRSDVHEAAGDIEPLDYMRPPTVKQVMDDLPALRPALSRRGRDMSDWTECFQLPMFASAVAELRARDGAIGKKVADLVESTVRAIQQDDREDPGTGADRWVEASPTPACLPAWYRDRDSEVLANHEVRRHMPSDLVRYLFVSAFGHVAGRSPKLIDFPSSLLPAHKNIDKQDIESAIFKDRFRVQVGGLHSMTVTSHIAKDGHAFIHYDPVQCRSLTVREAARLQTFPDSYVFLGNRTAQYSQVGNAVPPYLAVQIGNLVGRTLRRAGLPT